MGHFSIRKSGLVAFALTALTALMIACAPAVGQSLEDFYRGRQVKFIVGSAGGGGYEFYTRILAKHIGRHIPGNPSFILQTMPGAGGAIAANYLYNLAQRDGSEIAMLGRATITQTLLEPDEASIRFDPKQFNWIGSPQQEVGLILIR